MFGCFGNAPIISSFCTRAAAFAPFPADGAGAELAADGATEVSVLVWLLGADSVFGCSLSVWPVVVCTGGTGAVTGTMGVAGTDMTGETGLIGLTGDSTFVGFVIDFTQVSDDVTHEPHTGCPYGFGQVLVIV
jgi:hypothetical protein